MKSIGLPSLVLASVGALTLLAPETRAAEGVVKIRESTLNELAVAVLPHKFTTPFLVDLPWCGRNAIINLEGLEFQIREGAVRATGNATGSWCGVALEATASRRGCRAVQVGGSSRADSTAPRNEA